MSLSSLLRSDIAMWRPVPATGIRQMEEEHDRLIGYLAELRDAMVAGEGYAQLGRMLGQLADYARGHFQSEEELMDHYGFPAAQEHMREHHAILTELNQLIAGYQKGADVFAADLANVLHRWIAEHVTQYDMKLAEFLMSKGVT